MMDDQLTRCPHCKTAFLITDAELKRGGGAARCGACLKHFSASGNLFTLEVEGAELAAPEINESTSDFESSFQDRSNDSIDEFSQATAPASEYDHSDNSTHQNEFKPRDEFEGLDDSKEIEPASSDTLDTDDAFDSNGSFDIKGNIESQVDASSESNIENQPIKSLDQSELHLSAEADRPAKKENTFDLVKDNLKNNKPLLSVIALSGIVVIGVLVLISSTRSLSQYPVLNGVVENLCSVSDCEHPLMADFKPLEYSQLSLSKDLNQTLLVDFVLENSGENTLPFPGIIVELLSAEDTVVGQHTFQPDLYLKDMPFPDHKLLPELPVALTLPMPASNKTVNSFRLTFIPPKN